MRQGLREFLLVQGIGFDGRHERRGQRIGAHARNLDSGASGAPTLRGLVGIDAEPEVVVEGFDAVEEDHRRRRFAIGLLGFLLSVGSEAFENIEKVVDSLRLVDICAGGHGDAEE